MNEGATPKAAQLSEGTKCIRCRGGKDGSVDSYYRHHRLLTWRELKVSTAAG